MAPRGMYILGRYLTWLNPILDTTKLDALSNLSTTSGFRHLSPFLKILYLCGRICNYSIKNAVELKQRNRNESNTFRADFSTRKKDIDTLYYFVSD